MNRTSLAFLLAIVGLAGCAGPEGKDGFPNPGNLLRISVNPSSITVAAESVVAFSVSFNFDASRGTVSWSVNPSSGGTISSGGVYTASGTPGKYIVVATWTPSNPEAGKPVSGSATVEVLPVPQSEELTNIDLTQASGAIQTSPAVQNAGIVGQSVPFMISSDPSGNVTTRSGFTIPVVCPESDTHCQ